MTDDAAAAPPSRDGYVYAVGCYLIWGFLPLYFRLLKAVGAVEIVAHRIVWSLVLLVLILAARGRIVMWRQLLATARILLPLIGSAALIAINWLVYIWAVNHGHVVAASLGYFLNPLVNVALGMIFLGERLGRAQMVAVALAAAGVMIMAWSAPTALWISLTLAFSFAFYGLVRKVTPVGSLEGLATETLLLTPAMLAYLIWLWATGVASFGRDHGDDALLIASGVATSVPLLLFASAARRLSYGTLGLLQYLAPSIQFAIGVFLFGEPLTTAMLLCFALIWTGLAIFTTSAIIGHRRARRPLPA
jgi:chloramphenicol-sensitive protein RarD